MLDSGHMNGKIQAGDMQNSNLMPVNYRKDAV